MKKVSRRGSASDSARRGDDARPATLRAGEACSSPPAERLFSVSNHHVPHCGEPPSIDGDAPEIYHGYFENRHGEQALFEFDRMSGQCRLWCGDARWAEPYPVIDGRVPGLVLAPEELDWLRACWKAVSGGDRSGRS